MSEIVGLCASVQAPLPTPYFHTYAPYGGTAADQPVQELEVADLDNFSEDDWEPVTNEEET